MMQEGAVKLTGALSSRPQELVKLDLSCCGLTSPGITQICANIASIGSVTELNLNGSSIGSEVCHFFCMSH